MPQTTAMTIRGSGAPRTTDADAARNDETTRRDMKERILKIVEAVIRNGGQSGFVQLSGNWARALSAMLPK